MHFIRTASEKIVLAFCLILSVTVFSSCLTSRKMDKFVATQYNNEVPKVNTRKNPHIIIKSALPSKFPAVSSTAQKTSKVLPLVVYWQYDYRHTCTLNPAVATASFSNAVHSLANKGLNQKLDDQSIELTVEQSPNAFAVVAKGHIIWVVYAFSWENVFVESDKQDLIVSYTVLKGGSKVKAGKITVKNNLNNKGIGYFQSWKSATEEHLNSYNANMTAMAKTFVNQLLEEL